MREVRMLACYYNVSPDQLTEQQVADYLLYLINDCEFAPGTLRVSYSGIKSSVRSWRFAALAAEVPRP